MEINLLNLYVRTHLWNRDKRYTYISYHKCMRNSQVIVSQIHVVSVLFISIMNTTFSSNNSDVALQHILFQILEPIFKSMLNHYTWINSTCLSGCWLFLLHDLDHKSIYYKGQEKWKVKRTCKIELGYS